MSSGENLELLKYPIGKFSPLESYSQAELSQAINVIESLPERIEILTRTFSAKQWETPYREGGWTARQVVHHISDSHLNAYVRIKWTLTEDNPLIKAYNEKLWAETPEVSLDPTLSIGLLIALHLKWTALLRLIRPEDLKRQFVHPETKKQVSIERMIALYAWHSEHHYAHLKIIAGKG